MFTYKSVFHFTRHPSFLRRLSRSLLLTATFFHTRSRLQAHLIISDYVLHVYKRMYSKYDIVHGETCSNSVRLDRSNFLHIFYNLILIICCVLDVPRMLILEIIALFFMASYTQIAYISFHFLD